MKERYQVTLNPTLVLQARKQMLQWGFDSFSDYLEHLIREEVRRAGAGSPPNPPDLRGAAAGGRPGGGKPATRRR